MSSIHAPRPFCTLGVKPFLFAQPPDLELIQKEYFRLSRKFHPDLLVNASDETRAMQEAASAQLNADYARLKEFWKLVESVVHGAKVPQASAAADKTPARVPSSGANVPPPALALDYFELQELWSEKGAVDAAVRTEAQNFLTKVSVQLSDAEAKVILFAKKFPFQGLGDAPAPWSEKDLEDLNQLLQQLRYFRSFANDIQNKFLSTPL